MLLRICVANNEGKTPQTLEILRQFFNTVPNSKALWVIAEGRGLSDENRLRCGLKFVYAADEWETGTIFVLETNVFELFVNTVKTLVKDNDEHIRYAFVVDSVDGLILEADSKKEISENNKVAGTPALSKKMLQSLSLGMFKFGHLMVLLSQVTAEIKLDPYTKTPNRGGQFSGGNALLHAADFILEYQPSFACDFILNNPAGKLNDGTTKSIGKYAKVVIQKSGLEASKKVQVNYPIKFGKRPCGIWVEYEISDMLLQWWLLKKEATKTSWLSLDTKLQEELKGLCDEVPEKIQGMNQVREFLADNPKVTDYLFDKFKKLICG